MIQGSIVKTGSATGVWEAYLQRRVMHLLLQHDRTLFKEQFRVFFEKSELPSLPLLQFYDHYLKLKLYHKELLEDILPRIKRQWSLQTSNLSLQETAPTRGEIDWNKTIQRTMAEAPDQLPLQFDTNLRMQSMIIPENIAVVAILRYYQKMIQFMSRQDQVKELLNEAERQELVSIEEHLERELASPQTRITVSASTRNDIDMLVEQVRKHLRPGTSPYWDLLNWWEHISTLAIGLANERLQPAMVNKQRKEQDESQLYELWLALELLTLHLANSAVITDEIHISLHTLTWHWQQNEQRYRFIYQHNAIHEDANWNHLVMRQPHYLIEREHPFEITHKGKTIWKEPPCIIEAAYTNGAETMQHLLGSMQAFGATRAILLTPLADDAPEERQWSQETAPKDDVYTSRAARHNRIRHYQIMPDMKQADLRKRLSDIVEHAIASFPERREPVCHGMMINTNSTNESSTTLLHYDVICPKPHIGPDVFDLVNRAQHCLLDATYCHVIGKGSNPPHIPPQSKEDLDTELHHLQALAHTLIEQASTEEEQEQQRNQIIEQLGKLVEEFTSHQSGGNTFAQEKYLKAIFFGGLWETSPRKLAKETRDILISGEYVWDEYEKANLQDWAAPAIQYCRALEREIKLRLYEISTDYTIPPKKWTLGTAPNLYLPKGAPDYKNQNVLKSVIKQSGVNEGEFGTIMQRMLDDAVPNLRNDLAHGKYIDRATAEKIKNVILGTPKQEGLLHWITSHLDI